MTLLSPPLSAVVLGLFVAVAAPACKPSTPAAPAARGDAAVVQRALDGIRAQVTLTAEGARVSGALTHEGHGLEGARVEVLDAPTASATVSSASGEWSLPVPAGRPTYLRVAKASYRTVQSGVVVAQAGAVQIPREMVPNTLLERIFRGVNLTENPAAGVVAVRFNLPERVTSRGLKPAGFGATLSEGGGSATVIGGDQPRLGNVTIGGEEIVIVLNVAPGTTTVTAQAPAGFVCEPAAGGLTTVRVDPQVVTFVAFDCR